MAAKRKSADLPINYRQLNEFSLVVLFDTTPRKKRGRLYDVKRIIARRRIPCGHEYLVKWKGWPYDSCTWEPAQNLTPDRLRSYSMPPKPAWERMEFASRDFLHGVQTFLKGKSMATIYINMELDVWRYITMNKGTPSEHIGYKMYEKQDFQRFDSLPPADWYYWLDQHGEGKSIDFPMKAKPTVSWTTSRYIMNNGNLVKAPKLPVEKFL